MTTLAKRLHEIAEQYKCPWGDPGGNPDYFSPEDYNDVRLAAAEIKQLQRIVQQQSATIQEMGREIERLRTALQSIADCHLYNEEAREEARDALEQTK